jgi:hypothetical protein
MGMYTAFHYYCELKKDVPEKVVEVLSYMNGDGDEPKELPDHSFFSCDRWRHLFKMGSYYFAAQTHSSFRKDDITNTYFLTVTSNLKNYDGEIESFIDWISPYVRAERGNFMGYKRYEEDEMPTLLIHSIGG